MPATAVTGFVVHVRVPPPPGWVEIASVTCVEESEVTVAPTEVSNVTIGWPVHAIPSVAPVG